MTQPNFADKTSQREALLLRIERMTELPLVLLAFAMIPLLAAAASFLWDLSPEGEYVVFILDSFVWAVFAADLVVKIAIATDRWGYIRRHWLDVLIVLIPFIRPLRILRIIVYIGRGFEGAARLARIDYVLVYAIGLVLIVATVVTTAERGSGSPLEQFPNALWWAIVTATTVGYGDMVPTTAIGKAAGVVLMLGGIGLFGAVAANLASLLVTRPHDNTALEDLAQEVKALRAEVADLRGGQHG